MDQRQNNKIEHLRTIQDVGTMLGQPTHHPLVGVFDLGRSAQLTPRRQIYGLYCIILKNNSGPAWGYGMSEYKYQNGSLIALAPGQVTYPLKPEYTKHNGLALYVHPDLIRGTVLGRMIWEYRFLRYNFNVAIFLRDRDRKTVIRILNQLEQDLVREGEQLNIVYVAHAFKQILDLMQLVYKENLEDYRKTSRDQLMHLEERLMDYLQQNKGLKLGPPSVTYFAQLAKLTTNHFGDMVKDNIDISAKYYLNMKTREHAMELLLSPGMSVNKVAQLLGFSHTAHFTRFFKQATGKTPSRYARDRRELLDNAKEEFIAHPERYTWQEETEGDNGNLI